MNEFDRSSNPSAVDQYIGRRLRQARERLGETPQYVADALRMSVVDYLQTEAGVRRLGAEPITRAANLLRVELRWFFEGLAKSDRLGAEADVQFKNVIDLNRARLRKGRPLR